MADREYWSSRRGRGPVVNPTIYDVYRTLILTVDEMLDRDYFQQWFGKHCVDAGYVRGRAGVEIGPHIERTLAYRDAWPLADYDPWGGIPEGEYVPDEVARDIESSFEDRVFDLIEYLHDHISEGDQSSGEYHSYAECGWHFELFRPEPARQLLRSRLARVLRNYGDGYRLNDNGQVEHTGPKGLADLLNTPLLIDEMDVRERVDAAIRTYRSRGRTVEDQRDAVRNLFDVLEKLRPRIKESMLRGDERDLFMMANGLNIRHMNERQKAEYDGPLWLSWMFYVALSTVHLMTRIADRPNE